MPINKPSYLCLCLLAAIGLSACGDSSTEQKKSEQSKESTDQVAEVSSSIADKSADISAAVSSKAASLKDKLKDKMQNKMAGDTLTLKGSIVYQSMEGGFYSFIADNGDKYTLVNLPDEHKQNGLVVSLEGSVMHDMMTTKQFGQVLQVDSATVLDSSKVVPIDKRL